MNKAELAAAIAAKSNLSSTDANAALTALIDVVGETLARGDDIRLVGFGTFAVSDRPASKGRNPATGAEIDIPARKVPKFVAGKALKEAVNGG